MNNPSVSDVFRALVLHTFGLPISPEDSALAEKEMTRLQATALIKTSLGNHGSRDRRCDSSLTPSSIGCERVEFPTDGLDRIIRRIEAEIRKFQPDWTPTESWEDAESIDEID